MRLFASWWEQFPWREVAPTLLTALAVVGVLGHAGAAFTALARISSFVWG